MATAIVPLVMAGIPLAVDLFNAIAGLVHQKAPVVEAQYGRGTGPIKIVELVQSVTTELLKAVAAGTLPKLPEMPYIQAGCQAVISSMKLQGLLEPATTATAKTYPPTKTLMLKSGDSLSVIVT